MKRKILLPILLLLWVGTMVYYIDTVNTQQHTIDGLNRNINSKQYKIETLTVELKDTTDKMIFYREQCEQEKYIRALEGDIYLDILYIDYLHTEYKKYVTIDEFVRITAQRSMGDINMGGGE